MTLSTAKLLKENGWFKETERVWFGEIPIVNPADCVIRKLDLINFPMTDDLRRLANKETYPCPSTDELLAELNKATLTKVGNNYSAIYFGDSPMDCRSVEDLTDPTECLALLWIKLKQENIGG